MTIPVQPVSIHPQLAPRQNTPWEELFLKAVQHGQELGLQRQKLKQEQAEFELRKKLMGPQAESLALDIEKKKRDLKAAQEDHDAQERAHTIYTGMLAQGRITPEEWSRELQNANDPVVHKWLTQYRDEAIATATHQQTLGNLALQGQGQDLQNQQRTQDMSEDRQIHSVLQPLAGRQWNRQTISKAIGQVVAINPQKAGQVATALNALLPDYQIVLNEDGTVGYAAKAPSDPSLGVKPKRPTDEQNKLATYAVRVLEANATMTELEDKFPGIGQATDDRLRSVRVMEQVPAVGRPIATGILPSVLRTLTPEARKYANARIDLGNALLRRASGAQINMEELDRETTPYVPVSGQDNSIVPSIQQRRLQQGLLFSEQSGSAFNPNRLSPAARRYLLQRIAPNPGYSPDNPFAAQPGTQVVPQ